MLKNLYDQVWVRVQEETRIIEGVVLSELFRQNVRYDWTSSFNIRRVGFEYQFVLFPEVREELFTFPSLMPAFPKGVGGKLPEDHFSNRKRVQTDIWVDMSYSFIDDEKHGIFYQNSSSFVPGTKPFKYPLRSYQPDTRLLGSILQVFWQMTEVGYIDHCRRYLHSLSQTEESNG